MNEEFAPLAQIEATPAILRALLVTLNDAEAAWKPAEKRWSVLEVLAHLCHVEIVGLRERTERMLAEDDPELPDYDQNQYDAAGVYRKPWRLADALAEFESLRAGSVLLLYSLPAIALERPGRHGALGAITLCNLLNEWALHDLGHVRQIAELVRAVKYYPQTGAWQRFYMLHP